MTKIQFGPLLPTADQTKAGDRPELATRKGGIFWAQIFNDVSRALMGDSIV